MTKCFIKWLEHCLTHSKGLYTCLSRKEKSREKLATIKVLIWPSGLLRYLSRTLTMLPLKFMEHENAPKISLKPATVVVSFWQKMLLGEHWLVKKEGLWLPSRVMKWKTKIPRLDHANGCGSPLAALLGDSRHFWTCFWKGLSSQWLILLHLLASFLPVVGRLRMEREGWCQRSRPFCARKDEPPGQHGRGQVSPRSFLLSMTHIVTLHGDQIWIWAMTKPFWKPSLFMRVTTQSGGVSVIKSCGIFRLHTHPRPLLSTDDSPDQATTTFCLDSCRSLCPTWPFCFYPTYPTFSLNSQGDSFKRVNQTSPVVQRLRLHLPGAMGSIPSRGTKIPHATGMQAHTKK